MRVYALYLVVAFLSVYAYRDWFRSLCGLILLMAVVEHPDMPKKLFDIQGLSPWNLALLNVVVAWLFNRRGQGLIWDMPRHLNVLLLLCFLVVFVGFLRMLFGPNPEGLTATGMVSEYLINTIKWVVPGLLLFDGCRTRRRLATGLVVILALYVLLAVQVIRCVPPGAALSGDTLTLKSRKAISRQVGYHAVNAAMILAGGSWAVLATLPLVSKRRHQVMVVGLFLVLTYALALTAGRMGYVTWAIVGLILCLLRWRRRLLLLPLLALVIIGLAPGAVERMQHGFGELAATGESYTDPHVVTSDRTLIWPYVVDRIMQSPFGGYGRRGMLFSGLTNYVVERTGEVFRHPHNAYLEWALDNGLLGLLLILALYGIILKHSVALFRNRNNVWHAAVGGVASALLLALLVGGMGSQTLYPREETVGMWAAIGLLLRLSVAARAAVHIPVSRFTLVDAFRPQTAGLSERLAYVTGLQQLRAR